MSQKLVDAVPRSSADALIRGHHEVLSRLNAGAPLTDALDAIAALLGALLPEGEPSIMLVDETGRLRVGAAPGLAKSYLDRIDGLVIGPNVGSCGSAAALGVAVIAADLQVDPRWEGFRELAAEHGLRACWSVPVFSRTRKVLGTFAVYHRAAYEPTKAEIDVVLALVDLTGVAIELHRTHEALRLGEERFRLLAHATQDAIWDWNLATDELWWSDGLDTLFGFRPSEVESTADSWLQRVHPEDRAAAVAAKHRAIASGERSWSSEYRFRRADGSFAHVVDRANVVRDGEGRAVRLVGGMTDVTAQRRLEREALRTERLESLGSLAGGIAHDLNNLLTPILLGVDALEPVVRERPDAVEFLDAVRVSARRGADMVRQVLTFARGAEGRRVAVDLGELVRETVAVIRDTLPRSVQVEVSLAEGLEPVLGDPTQLHQVLLNLCVNARDAMPEGGTLRVEARLAKERVGARREVEVRVVDTGLGIPVELRERVFDPFFTTKPHGQGTGLGLSMVAGIVRGHGGSLHLDSELGQGTVVVFTLPVAPPSASPIAPALPARPEHRPAAVILFVDDEPLLRRVAQRTLELRGHRVLLAANGAEALEVFALHAHEVDLVISDVMMPVMDGLTATRALLERAPELPVLITSGLSSPDDLERWRSAGARACLEKPYTVDMLVERVDHLLGAVTSRRPSGA